MHRDATPNLYAECSEWPPSAAAIRQRIGPPTPTGPSRDEARRHQFAKLLTTRFHDHNPPLAVALRFETAGADKVSLLCPASTEPWNLDRVATAVWKETQTAFGRPFDVDIFETFIGMGKVKVGELRPDPTHPEQARITYQYAKPRTPRLNYSDGGLLP